MMIFVDTSALYALADNHDGNHARALQQWKQWQPGKARPVLLSSNYAFLECSTLIQRRLGMEALREFHESVAPLLRLEWITPVLHAAALEAVFAANRRDLSLVDCTSFALMRQLGMDTAFVFNSHFAEQGFTCLPEGE